MNTNELMTPGNEFDLAPWPIPSYLPLYLSLQVSDETIVNIMSLSPDKKNGIIDPQRLPWSGEGPESVKGIPLVTVSLSDGFSVPSGDGLAVAWMYRDLLRYTTPVFYTLSLNESDSDLYDSARALHIISGRKVWIEQWTRLSHVSAVLVETPISMRNAVFISADKRNSAWNIAQTLREAFGIRVINAEWSGPEKDYQPTELDPRSRLRIPHLYGIQREMIDWINEESEEIGLTIEAPPASMIKDPQAREFFQAIEAIFGPGRMRKSGQPLGRLPPPWASVTLAHYNTWIARLYNVDYNKVLEKTVEIHKSFRH